MEGKYLPQLEEAIKQHPEISFEQMGIFVHIPME
jgi:hypothetical protein